MTLGALQFYGSRPSQLKKGVLHERFTAVRGRLLFVAFEQEIYLELESDSTSVQEFLQSRAFEEPKSDDLLMASLYQAPFDWFQRTGNLVLPYTAITTPIPKNSTWPL